MTNSILGLGMGYQNNGSRTKKTDLVFGIDPITGNPISDPSFPTHARFSLHPSQRRDSCILQAYVWRSILCIDWNK